MRSTPFVWQVQVRREVLDDELARLRELPYGFWKELIGGSISKTVTGRDNRSYRVTVTPEPLGDGSTDIRIAVTLARASLLRRRVMHQEFIVSERNEFRF